MTEQEIDAYPPGTIVFAKLKGYPWWPAKIEDERRVPVKVMKQKTKAKSPLWTVFFFGSRDYGFFGLDSIRPFNKANVEKDLKAKKFKTKDLEMAIREALDPTLMEKNEQEHGEGEEEDDDDQQEDDDAQQQEETRRGKKKSNGKAATKSSKTMTTTTTAAAAAAVAAAAAAAAATGSSTKKLSRTTKASSDEDMDTQLVNSNKRGVTDDNAIPLDKKKRRKSMSVEKENHHRSNGHSSTASSSIKENEPLEITREYKRLYHLRHRLQKLMYEKKQGTIPLDDYVKISQTLKDVEEAPMTYELLRHTKIGKVVKCGIIYEFENDTEFNIHERCQQLMRKWKEMFVDTKEQVKVNDTTTTATATDGHDSKESTPVDKMIENK